MTEISGLFPSSLSAVRDRFAGLFEEGLELGARFSVCLDGEVILDLMGGHADLARARPFGEDTLVPVFSTTKAVMAVMIARLVDRGLTDYETRVADIWPAFGQAGKGEITLGQMMSHQAGLPGLAEPAPSDVWLDPPALAGRLAAQAPMWPPGTASGYHPSTLGYLAGEVFRRVDGRTLGTAFREDIAAPFGLDFWIGLPEAEEPRLAEMKKPPAPPDLGVIDDIKRAAFLDRGAVAGTRAWRAVELPATNGIGTAPALARLLSIMANEGELDGYALLSPDTVRALSAERISGPDRVLPFTLSWAAGLLRNQRLNALGPGQETVGHYGWGGSCVMADPQRRLSAAYVMNRQSPQLVADPRPVALFEALYSAL